MVILYDIEGVEYNINYKGTYYSDLILCIYEEKIFPKSSFSLYFEKTKLTEESLLPPEVIDNNKPLIIIPNSFQFESNLNNISMNSVIKPFESFYLPEVPSLYKKQFEFTKETENKKLKKIGFGKEKKIVDENPLEDFRYRFLSFMQDPSFLMDFPDYL